MVILAVNHCIESVSAPACQHTNPKNQSWDTVLSGKNKINCAHIFLQECVHVIVSSSFLLGLSSWYDMLKGLWFRIFSHWEENYFHFTRSENVFKDYMVISNIENTFSITSGKKSVWQLRHCGGVLSCSRCVERTPVKAAQTHKKCCTLTNTQLIYTQETSLWDSSRLDPNATHKTKLNLKKK